MSWEYKNGNYTVRILNDGTKMRLSDNPIPELPESIDVKVTNKCNGGCEFCHEQSHPNGKDFDVSLADKLFKNLPCGIELAIGGGNPLECIQNLRWLTKKLLDNKIIVNLTVNAQHLNTDFMDKIYFNALGISYRSDLHKNILTFDRKYKDTQKVIHLIAGVHTLQDLKSCHKSFKRILILGYKRFGRGADYYDKTVRENLKEWQQNIGTYICNNNKIVAFDNLAIQQLDVKRFFNETTWRDIYMGDDGEFSMYIDLVEKKFAKSSISKKFPIKMLSIKSMFNIIKKN